MRSDEDLLSLVRRFGARSVAGVVAVAFVAAVVGWYFGADVWHAILVGAAVATLGCIAGAVGAMPIGEDVTWPEPERDRAAGTRNDVLVLSESLRGRYGRIDPGVVRPVRQIARRRLARYRVDLDDPVDRPRIEQLIGSRSYRVLVPRRFPPPRPPSLRALVSCLDTLDALDNPPPRPEENR